MLSEYNAVFREILTEVGLLSTEALLLIALYEENEELLNIMWQYEGFLVYDRTISKLENFGLVKRHGAKHTDIMLRKGAEDMFKKHIKKKIQTKGDVHLWIDSWRDVFPPGMNTGGYRYRGSRSECLKKMIKFVQQNKYTKEEIFRATQGYVNRFATKGYAYMQQAHYFIDKKDSGSTLASECEGLNETPIKQGSDYGTGLI